MAAKELLLWGIEIHFKNGDVAFIDNSYLLMMKLTDIRSTYLSYSDKPELHIEKRCERVCLKIHKRALDIPQKDKAYSENGKSILEMLNGSSIEFLRLIDGNGDGEDIAIPWKQGVLLYFNSLQKHRFEMGDLVIEIGGLNNGK